MFRDGLYLGDSRVKLSFEFLKKIMENEFDLQFGFPGANSTNLFPLLTLNFQFFNVKLGQFMFNVYV